MPSRDSSLLVALYMLPCAQQWTHSILFPFRADFHELLADVYVQPKYIYGVITFIHRTDFHELFANVAATGCSLQICHIAASCGMKCNLNLVLEMIDRLGSACAATYV